MGISQNQALRVTEAVWGPDKELVRWPCFAFILPLVELSLM